MSVLPAISAVMSRAATAASRPQSGPRFGLGPAAIGVPATDLIPPVWRASVGARGDAHASDDDRRGNGHRARRACRRAGLAGAADHAHRSVCRRRRGRCERAYPSTAHGRAARAINVVENVAAAPGMVRRARAAKAAPDGDTALSGNTGTHALNQSLY